MNMSENIGECPIGSPSQPSPSNSRDSDKEVSSAKSSDLKTPSVKSNTNRNLSHDVSMIRSESPEEKNKDVDVTHHLATGKEHQMQAFSCNEVDIICKTDGKPDTRDVLTKENLNWNVNDEDGEQPQTLLIKKDILINIRSEIISSDKNNSANTTEITQNIIIKDDPSLNEGSSLNNVNVKKEHFELEPETMSKVEKIDECAENAEQLTYIKNEVEEKAKECGENGIVTKEELSNQSAKEELEDGEVSADDENDKSAGTSLVSQDICRFFLRKACTWGSKCRFKHPTSKDYGNYVMFEKKELPVSVPPIVYFPAWPEYSSNIMTSSENTFDSNLQSVKQMMQKAGYLPPTNRKFQESPTMSFSLNHSAYYNPLNQSSSPVERVTLLPTPSSSVAAEIQVPCASTPHKTSRSQKLLPIHHRRFADDRMPSKSRNLKSKSKKIRSSSSSSSSSISTSESSSNPQASGRRHQRKSRYFSSKSIKTRCGRSHIRGPRTPSLSPPRASVRNVINAPRKRRLISSSSSSSKDSYSTSSTYNSSSSECKKNRRKTRKTTTSSRKSSSARTSEAKSKKKDGSKNNRSKKSRQEYLLMKLLLVEDQIAKRSNLQ